MRSQRLHSSSQPELHLPFLGSQKWSLLSCYQKKRREEKENTTTTTAAHKQQRQEEAKCTTTRYTHSNCELRHKKQIKVINTWMHGRVVMPFFTITDVWKTLHRGLHDKTNAMMQKWMVLPIVRNTELSTNYSFKNRFLFCNYYYVVDIIKSTGRLSAF